MHEYNKKLNGKPNQVICKNKLCKSKKRQNICQNTIFYKNRIFKITVLKVIELWMQKAFYNLIYYQTGLRQKNNLANNERSFCDCSTKLL